MKPGDGEYHTEEKAQRVAWLVAGYLQKTLSKKEHDELDGWVTESDANQRLFEELITPTMLEQRLKEYDEPDEEAALAKIKSKIQFAPEKKITGPRNNYLLKIAAAILLLAGIAMTYQLMKNRGSTDEPKTITNVLQPGRNQAMLLLPDGSKINLGEAKNGLIDSIHGIDILKPKDGQVSYENNTSSSAAGQQHVLITPKGGQYSITLSDGSRVWVNAASSLKYPAVFDDKERIVELDGEGYFEVAHLTPDLTPNPSPGGEGNLKNPFIVKLRNGTEVKVTGTHFNINAYENEEAIKTTLLEGSVIVKCEHRRSDGKQFVSEAAPRPGEQAIVNDNGEVNINDHVNTAEVVAWKNGEFKFVDTPIEPIMRQVGRWYDATIEYEGKINYHFNATIYRNEPLSKLLSLLEMTGNVKFRIEGKKIIVRP
ncbi:MAG: FecR domain-containing protein [Chitinophagaceae bacterium]